MISHYISKIFKKNIMTKIICTEITQCVLKQFWVIKKYSIKLQIVDWWYSIRLEYVIFCLYYGGNSFVAAVAYLARDDAVLDALVLFFILVSLVERLIRGWRLWHLHTWALEVDICFVLLAEGTILGIYLNINQLDALNFIMSLFHASTCFEHKCSSSGGQNCIIQPLVSSHL